MRLALQLLLGGLICGSFLGIFGGGLLGILLGSLLGNFSRGLEGVLLGGCLGGLIGAVYGVFLVVQEGARSEADKQTTADPPEDSC